jgi:hypothetical protein
MKPSNTVFGKPEPVFRAGWLRLLWLTMAKTAKGYRKDPAGRQARPGAAKFYGERRADKISTTKLSRFLANQRSIAR